ncbi:unnamed protein product [Penicillium salamii]|uniref:Uncharacterized protein n=1 Tax=Penicillium salamii TaxID=1612424 RepID=A0A9W4I5F7_9EURO|nr:unnamed protein product [Penicillium salamii]CAG7964484.1 unnamed protein product [Penicillium salamii]CAG8238311.1 unnamed protein product [Penicillium salamii]CAG8241731.1 unnamed protein product [Penicillium salamii]CAG8315503.1 unnamed protein product [Penicillium salamii]
MYCQIQTRLNDYLVFNHYLGLLVPCSKVSLCTIGTTLTVQVKARGICDSQVMASENRLVEQRLGTALQAKKPSTGRSQISDENYISCMILLFLLFSGTSPVYRITAVEKETEQPAGTSTASMPKVHRPPLDLAFAPMTLVSDLLAQAQSTQVPQGKNGNYKITLPIKKARLPLVDLVNTSQFLKRRGWPKLKRLSQAVHRNSRRISLLRAHLSLLQSELEERTSSRNGSMKTTMCKQKLPKTQLPPSRMYLLGFLLIQHFLRKYNEGPVDGNIVNIPDLAALLIDQFYCLRALYDPFCVSLAILGGSAVDMSFCGPCSRLYLFHRNRPNKD